MSLQTAAIIDEQVHVIQGHLADLIILQVLSLQGGLRWLHSGLLKCVSFKWNLLEDILAASFCLGRVARIHDDESVLYSHRQSNLFTGSDPTDVYCWLYLLLM